jgi:hypothetical protein
MKTQMRLRHHGSPAFDPAKFSPIVDKTAWQVKPHGGLWTSPIDSEFGWREWCEAEDFHRENLKQSFDLVFSGAILVIDSARDLEKLPWVPLPYLGAFRDAIPIYYPKFAPLVLEGFDALHLTWQGQCKTRFSRPKSLYGWDCETVLIFNPKSILPI